MTINQLTNKTSILKDDLLLISEGSIDYKCTAKDLIFNSLSTFNGLTLGSESNYVNGVFTNGLSVAGTIDFKENPNFNTILGSSARPIWINNYPEAITASETQTVLACTGNDVNNSSSYNWLKYSSENKLDTLVLRSTLSVGTAGGEVQYTNIQADRFNEFALHNDGIFENHLGNKDIPNAAAVQDYVKRTIAAASTEINNTIESNKNTLDNKDTELQESINSLTNTFTEVKTNLENKDTLLENSINTINGTATEAGSFAKGDADTLASANEYTNNAVKIKKEDTANTTRRYFVNFEGNIGSGDVSPEFQSSDKIYVEYKDRDNDGDSEAWFTASYVCNAVWNDIADYLNVDKDLEIIYGRAYTRDPKTNKVRLAQKNERAIGLASDTCGFQLGKNDKEHQIPIALGGWILAYTDKNYKPGTLLKVGKKGILTKASKLDEIFNPSRIIASFDRVEKEETWHGKVVDGRNWVKIK